jgi:hypothetical protein
MAEDIPVVPEIRAVRWFISLETTISYAVQTLKDPAVLLRE